MFQGRSTYSTLNFASRLLQTSHYQETFVQPLRQKYFTRPIFHPSLLLFTISHPTIHNMVYFFSFLSLLPSLFFPSLSPSLPLLHTNNERQESYSCIHCCIVGYLERIAYALNEYCWMINEKVQWHVYIHMLHVIFNCVLLFCMIKNPMRPMEPHHEKIVIHT